MTTKETIENREPTYGNFAHRSRIAMGIKNAMMLADGWSRLTDAQKQALQTIADKVSRILNGDPNHLDSWHDIGGYALLIEEEIQQAERNRKQVAMFKPEELPGEKVDNYPGAFIQIARQMENNLRDENGGFLLPLPDGSSHPIGAPTVNLKAPLARTVTGPALPIDLYHMTNRAMMARPKEGCSCADCRPDLVRVNSCSACGAAVGRHHMSSCEYFRKHPADVYCPA